MVKAIKKKLGKKTTTTVAVLGSEEALSEVTEWIPSGFPDLDRILGGGWAVGRASEVYGDEGSGKSALAQMAIRQCQQQGGVAILLDFEVALDRAKMKNVGIDPERLIYVAPAHAEEGWETVWATIADLRQNEPDAPTLIVWDSIAAAVPKDELEGDMDDTFVGLHARIMSRGCRRLFREIADVRAHMMWINQNRSKIGGFSSFGGPQTDTTGGRAIKYAASQRLSCKVVKRLKSSTKAGTAPFGYLIKNTTDKCRLAPPHRTTEWVLDFRLGPSPTLTTRHLLVEAVVIKKATGKGMTGKVKAPWTDEPFRVKGWLQEIKKPGFRAGAAKALQEVIQAGGVKEYLEQNRPETDDEEDDQD